MPPRDSVSPSKTACGTKIVSTNSSSNLQLFSAAELAGIAASLGVANSNPSVAVTNGDWNAAPVDFHAVVMTNGNAVIRLGSTFSGNARVNYAVTFGR